MKQRSKMKMPTPDVLRYSMIMMLAICSHWSVDGQIIPDTMAKKYNYPTLSFRPDLSAIHKPINRFTTFEKNDLPFFCRIEHKIETGSKIAFRFRLGDLNYVNMLENKR